MAGSSRQQGGRRQARPAPGRQATLALLLLGLLGLGLAADPLLDAAGRYAQRRAVSALARLERELGLRLALDDLRVGLSGSVTLRGLRLRPRAAAAPQFELLARELTLRLRPWNLLFGDRVPAEVRGRGWTLRLGTAATPAEPERWLRRWWAAQGARRPRSELPTGSGRSTWPRPPQLYLHDLHLVAAHADGTPLELRVPLVTLRASAGELRGVVELADAAPAGLPGWVALQGHYTGERWQLALRASAEIPVPGAEAWLGHGLAVRGLRLDQGALWLEGLRVSAGASGSDDPVLRVAELGLLSERSPRGGWRIEARRPELRVESYPDGRGDSSTEQLLAWPAPAAPRAARAARQTVPVGLSEAGRRRVRLVVREGTLRWVRHRASGPPDYATLGGLELEIEPAAAGFAVVGRWEPGPRLGRVAVEGHVGSYGDLRLRVRPYNLALDAVGAASSLQLHAGRASGDLSVVLQGARVDLAGHLSLQDVAFSSRALARGRLSGLTSRMELRAWADLATERVRLESLAATLGDLELSAWGRLARQGTRLPYQLTVAMGPVPCRDIPRSLPRGLAPLLEGLELDGHANLRLRATGDLTADDEPVIHIDGSVDGFGVARDAGPDLARLAGPFMHTAFSPEGSPITVSVDPAVPGFTPYRRLGAYLRRAAVAAEDAGFYKHPGLDFGQIEASLERNLKEGRFARGGSTITQQVVKNLFLTREKTLSRKLQEAYLAWKLEQSVSKNRILEIYLNIIEWGPGVYGATAAAQYYFGSKPGQLSLPQATFLAALISSPVQRARESRSGRVPPGVLQAMQRILERMRSMDFITAGELARARNKAPRLRPHPELEPLPEAPGPAAPPPQRREAAEHPAGFVPAGAGPAIMPVARP